MILTFFLVLFSAFYTEQVLLSHLGLKASFIFKFFSLIFKRLPRFPFFLMRSGSYSFPSWDSFSPIWK